MKTKERTWLPDWLYLLLTSILSLLGTVIFVAISVIYLVPPAVLAIIHFVWGLPIRIVHGYRRWRCR